MSKSPTFDPDATASQAKEEDVQRRNMMPLRRTDFSMDILDKWSEVRTLDKPRRRSHHSGFITESFLYIVGGVDISDVKQDDIFKVNLAEEKPMWELIIPQGPKLNKVAFHAGGLIGDVYYFFGGQLETLRTSSSLWSFNIKENTIQVANFEESQCPPLESHSCDVYEGKCLFYGGHKNKVLNGDIYAYNPEGASFTKLTQSIAANAKPAPRQEHSTTICGDSLYIFGGFGKNDSIFNDMWSYDLKSNVFTKIDYTGMEPEMIPAPRSGHSMNYVNNNIYIFGGFLGLVNESNELWKFDISQKKYVILHDSVTEKFTNEDLERTKKSFEEHNKTNKKFRWLSKQEVEKRTNPSPFAVKGTKVQNNQTSSHQKQNSLTDFKTPHSNDVLSRPNVIKMKKSLVYTSTNEDLNNALNNLSKNEKAMNNNDSNINNGNLPDPRDGHSMIQYQDKLVCFGGDRNKFPFNDLYYFSVN